MLRFKPFCMLGQVEIRGAERLYFINMNFLKKKRTWLGLIFLAVMFVEVWFLARPATDKDRTVLLPRAFLDARFSAALVSRRIVELTGETNATIKEINILDGKGDSRRARALVGEARTNNEEAYRSAFELSRHLQALAESLSELKSTKSQRIAYEAVAIELSLVSEFINYTEHLNDFLDKLDRALAANTPALRNEIYDALRDVNESAETINKLNNEFSEKMRKFDDSL